MKDIMLLDCTLRDGGYVNDWKFGSTNITSIFERLADSGVELIEIGFLNDKRPFDKERSIMPDTKSADEIFGKFDKKKSLIVGMIDYGTCSIENLAPASETCIDIIRVIFKKGKMYDAMKFCKQVKDLGYIVTSQLVSVTSYSDEDLFEVIKLINDVKPYAVGMVDTYGLLDANWMLHIYEILDNNIDASIKIGFHAHNNFQLAYSNSLAFLEYPGKHDVIVDGTLYGMGKSAGNAPIELVSMTLNDKYGKNYDISPMLESINESVLAYFREKPWGYQPFFYLVAKNQVHPNYLTDYENEKNLSVSMLDKLLATIEPEDKKLLYDKELGKVLYNKFIEDNFNDNETIYSLLDYINNRPVLLLGPGKNIILQSKKVNKFIDSKKPSIISINYIPDGINVDLLFVTNPKRYHDMTLPLKNCNAKILATTNVYARNGKFDFVVNRAPLLEKDEAIIDNSFLMLLNLLHTAGLKEVWCAGFDGYSSNENNYYNPVMEYSFIKKEANNLNSHIKNRVNAYRKSMDINFITYTAYDKEDDITNASI